jgi:hypothetical protein
LPSRLSGGSNFVNKSPQVECGLQTLLVIHRRGCCSTLVKIVLRMLAIFTSTLTWHGARKISGDLEYLKAD